MTTPARIAFGYEDGNYIWGVSENIIDSCFGFDIILTFFSAIEDQDLKIIDDRVAIFKNYFYG